METKPLLIETIRIQNGRVRNIKYHNLRCNNSRKTLFNCKNNLDLRNIIDTTKIKITEVKCRITYDKIVRKVEYEAYSTRPIRSLKMIEIDNFDYSFKYANRDMLSAFFKQREDKDDILMTKNGFITDTFYANVALYKNGKWYTPKSPLLQGSRRAQLLEKGLILEIDIHESQVYNYDLISIFNAMIPLGNITISLDKNLNLVE